jgi:cyclopropane-fatty-acyl-phospholipid synthase
MGATAPEVQVSYDVGNEFFRLWLDERMNYTGALFDGEDLSLEQAQLRKLAWLHEAAHVSPGARVLDIGCGWGCNLETLIERGASMAHGLTLSPAQHEEIRRHNVPGVSAECVSYLDYRPNAAFDALISIGMMEHVLSPEEARAGRTIDVYRRYFELAHEFTRPGAWFALQTITRERMPRQRDHAREIGWATRTIFPGSLAPRLEDIVVAMSPFWEVIVLRTGRDDYARTCEHWRARLRSHETEIRRRFGDAQFDQYDRYLTACILGFTHSYLSLARFSLRRLELN